jgi:hypothetical protein
VAVLEQALFAAVENIQIIVEEAKKVGMQVKVHAVPARLRTYRPVHLKCPAHSLYLISGPGCYREMASLTRIKTAA